MLNFNPPPKRCQRITQSRKHPKLDFDFFDRSDFKAHLDMRKSRNFMLKIIEIN